MSSKDASSRWLPEDRCFWGRRTLVAIGISAVVWGFSMGPNVAAQGPQSGKAADTASPVSKATMKIMAQVNGQQITRQPLAEACLRHYGDEVLESVVNKHLIWQACQTRGIAITDADVDREITRLASKFGLSPGRWLTLLQQERDLSAEQYRREIVWPTLALRALAAKQIVVTPQELREAYETEYGPRVKVRAITVSSRKKAEEVYQLAVAKPEAFGDLAKQYSEDASASVNGLVPPIRKHWGDAKLEQTAFSLKEGAVSPIVQVANQYVILKCEKQLPEIYVASRFRKDAEDRIRDQVQDQKLRSTAAQLFQQLQNEAQVTNVFNSPELRQKMPGVAALINGQKISIQQLAEECIARHGKEVLDGEINRTVLLQELKRRGLDVTQDDINREISRAADAYGYVKKDGTPDIETWLETVTKKSKTTVEVYVRDAVWPSVALKKMVDQKVTVSDEDIQKGFVSNYGPRVEILAIVLTNQREAQKVWEMARGNPTDNFFGELAHQYSVDPISRENFGRVPPIRRHGGRPELEKEAFSLQPGQLSGIIASEDKYVILRCTGHTTPVVTKMDADVRAELVKDIHEKKLRLAMNVQFDRLLEEAQIDNFLTGTSQAGKRQTTRGTAPLATASRPTAGPRRR